MLTIEPADEFKIKIYLKSKDVPCRIFEDINDFYSNVKLDFIEKNVGSYYGDLIKIIDKRAKGLYWDKDTDSVSYSVKEESHYHPASYIVRTDLGEVLNVEALRDIYWRLRAKLRKRGPLMGRKASRVYSNFKNPKTSNELRQAFRLEEEGEPPIRCKRNQKHLITAWDDNMADTSPNWKKQSKRRHQYRPK